jgi:RNA polymerase-binding transcription factor DksA
MAKAAPDTDRNTKATRKRPATKKASARKSAKASNTKTATRADAKKQGRASSKTASRKASGGASKTARSANQRSDGRSTKAAKTRSKTGLDAFLEGQLRALEQERATYLHQAETLQAEADSLTEDREPGDVQFDEESGEGDTLAVERERDLALSAQARSAIEEIDLAIAKIHDGSYGQCVSCGARIPKERLKALPYAVLCVRCKSGGLGLGR